MKNAIDKIVLGHNAFFGVDHLSASRGQEREAYFANPERVIDLIVTGVEMGVTGMMMSTHARAAEILPLVKKNKTLSSAIRFYPLLPYVQKYVVAANKKGIMNVIADALKETSNTEKLRLAWTGAKSILGKDVRSTLSSLIQMEMFPFRGLEFPCVFLHDLFTDLALALDLKGVFEFYIEEIDRLYGAEAAFTTKNLPAFLKKFKEWGLGTPVVMTHVNACGFYMNPSQKEVEESLNQFPTRVMAMSTLASGHLTPGPAYEYLGKLKGIESIVVGVSSKKHMAETLNAIRSHVFPDSRSLKLA